MIESNGIQTTTINNINLILVYSVRGFLCSEAIINFLHDIDYWHRNVNEWFFCVPSFLRLKVTTKANLEQIVDRNIHVEPWIKMTIFFSHLVVFLSSMSIRFDLHSCFVSLVSLFQQMQIMRNESNFFYMKNGHFFSPLIVTKWTKRHEKKRKIHMKHVFKHLV